MTILDAVRPDLVFIASDAESDTLRVEVAKHADADGCPGASVYLHTTEQGVYLKPEDVDELIASLRQFGTGQPDPTVLDERRVAAFARARDLLGAEGSPGDVTMVARFLAGESVR